MIVARGLGRGGSGAIVAFGLGTDVVEEPPVVPPSGGGSAGVWKQPVRSKYQERRARLLAEDEAVLAVIMSAVTTGVLH